MNNLSTANGNYETLSIPSNNSTLQLSGERIFCDLILVAETAIPAPIPNIEEAVRSFDFGATNSELSSDKQYLVDRLVHMLDIHGENSDTKFDDWLHFIAQDTTYGKYFDFPSNYTKTLKFLHQAGLPVSLQLN